MECIIVIKNILSFLLHEYLEVEQMDRIVNEYCTFGEMANLIFQVFVSLHIASSCVWEVQVLHILTAPDVVSVFTTGYAVVSQCAFHSN